MSENRGYFWDDFYSSPKVQRMDNLAIVGVVALLVAGVVAAAVVSM